MPEDTSVEIDLVGYVDKQGQQIAEGRYRFLVHDAKVEKANTGNTMIVVWLKVLTPGEFDGAIVLDRLTLTEKSRWRIVGFMQALGLPTPLKKFRIDVRTFVGRQVDADVADDEPYMGRIKSVVRGYMRVAKAQANGEVTDLDDELAHASGMAEFDAATTTNPAPEQSAPRTPPAAAEAAALPAPDTSEVPDEVDLDSLDLG